MPWGCFGGKGLSTACIHMSKYGSLWPRAVNSVWPEETTALSCREHELSAIGSCTPRSTRASIPSSLRRPFRWADAVQPAPAPYPNGSATQKLRVQAKLGAWALARRLPRASWSTHP
jgi:hypothetical protein